VVIVEDDPHHRRLFQAVLESGGYRVSAFETADEGLDAIKAARPDLILVDLMLPGISGQGLIRRIRSQPELEHAAILVVTGAASPDLTGCGPVTVLPKPINARELVRVCNELTGQGST
jgi:CheY-like chemotaxis protein